MTSDLLLRRKWTFKAHGKQVVFIKHAKEQSQHVIMKALMWALYLPEYANVSVEIPVGDRYKPDLVALSPEGYPLFWGEAGKVSADKIRALVRRYRNTHFAIAKWNMNLTPLIELVGRAVAKHSRSAPFDVIRFPADSAERFIDGQGHIHVTHDALEWVRL